MQYRLQRPERIVELVLKLGRLEMATGGAGSCSAATLA
jgi:hypothetical protein